MAVSRNQARELAPKRTKEPCTSLWSPEVLMNRTLGVIKSCGVSRPSIPLNISATKKLGFRTQGSTAGSLFQLSTAWHKGLDHSQVKADDIAIVLERLWHFSFATQLSNLGVDGNQLQCKTTYYLADRSPLCYAGRPDLKRRELAVCPRDTVLGSIPRNICMNTLLWSCTRE